jgi:hypothetical protein
MTEGLITPDQLRQITDQKEKEKLQEALEKKRKADDEHHQLHDAFMSREIHPDVLVVRFSSQYCTDGGRAINNFEPEWPDTVTGFAKRAYEFWQKELKPQGYKVRAQIMDFPGGVPGDVGMFLRW